MLIRLLILIYSEYYNFSNRIGFSILEMFANKGSYDSNTEDFIDNLTQEQLIDLINTKTER